MLLSTSLSYFIPSPLNYSSKRRQILFFGKSSEFEIKVVIKPHLSFFEDLGPPYNYTTATSVLCIRGYDGYSHEVNYVDDDDF